MPPRFGLEPATEAQCAELLVAVVAQEELFRRHVMAKEQAARGFDRPTMALTLSRAHLERALATEEELHAGRAWLLETYIPQEALVAAERDDEAPVLLDLPGQRVVVFVGRERHPRFWGAELAKREVERTERELDSRVYTMGSTTPGPYPSPRFAGEPGGAQETKERRQ